MKELALNAIKIAAGIYPPIAKLLGDAFALYTHSDDATDGERALVDQVRAILPESSRSAEVVIDLSNEE